MIADNILASTEREQKDHERKQLDEGRRPIELTIIAQPKRLSRKYVSRRLFKKNFE